MIVFLIHETWSHETNIKRVDINFFLVYVVGSKHNSEKKAHHSKIFMRAMHLKYSDRLKQFLIQFSTDR